MPNSYARLSDFRADLRLTDVEDDAVILRLIESVSRAIDNETGRHFYAEVDTKTLDADGFDYLNVPDLLSVSDLDVDDSGALDYTQTLTAGMYRLRPTNKTPKTRIYINPQASGLPFSQFPSAYDGVRVAGVWGYSNETELTGATLTEALDDNETGIDVSSGTLIDVGETIVIDDEQMHVSAIATNTLTVTRGLNGTTAATHLTALPVYRRRYERPIERATIMQVTRIMRDQQTGFSGSVANSEFGGFAFNALYPAIRDLLKPYKRNWVFA